MSRTQALVAAFAVLAAAFFANLIFGAVDVRRDLTEDRTFTLSPGSLKVVRGLEEPVTLELFASRSDVKLRPYLESYARRVETLLREYAARSGGKVRLTVTDPRPDTKEEQRAQRHALGAMRTPQGSAYLGLTATQADTVKAVPMLDPSRERFLEYDVTKLIASASRLERPKLAIISGLPLGGAPSPQGDQGGPADFLIAELGQTFEVVTLSNQETALPKDVKVVALIHPFGLAEGLAYQVDQFLMNGGPVFVAADPLSRFQKFQQGSMPFMVAPMAAMGASSDPALLRGWGVNAEMAGVSGDAANSVAIRGSRGEPVQYPSAFSVPPPGLAPDSPLTSDLRELGFMEAGELALISGAEKRLKLTPLVSLTGPGAGSVPTASATAGPFEKVALAFKPDGRARVLAATVTGTFTSAFPDGPPKAAPGPDGKPAPAPKADGHLKESVKPGRLLVVADSDFMLDPFTVRQRQIGGGQVAMEAINDNLSFALSALETLAGSEELVELRSKGTSIRPFTKVLALEREASMRYQAKLDEIERKLEEANARITELSRTGGAGVQKGALVVTPEMQREVQKFQDEVDRLSEERRVIRRGLSEDVNSLGRRLQVLNLVAGPALAALLGLLYALSRRRKSS